MAASTTNVEPAPLAPGLWARAAAGETTLIPQLAKRFWYPAYAWLRAAGSSAEDAPERTRRFFAWIETSVPPSADEPAAARMGDFLLERLPACEMAGFPECEASAPAPVDGARAERRWALEQPRPADMIFARRWALAVIETALAQISAEYEADGKNTLFPLLKPFLAFTGDNEQRYADEGAKAGLSASAFHVAVFRFRQRYREMLRATVNDTVRSPDDVDAELTKLLISST